MRSAGWARAAFASTMVGLGALGLARGAFTAIWLPVPGGVPGREGLIYLCAIVPLASGVGLLGRRSVAAASTLLLVFLLAWLLFLDGPQLFAQPGMQLTWAASKTAALVAAAWVLYVQAGGDSEGRRGGLAAGHGGLRIARSLYGLALIPFGIAHFTYLQRTISLVPGWLPWHPFWAYLFGCTFIAAGLAVILDVCAPLAASLSAVQLALFTLLVWGPVVARGPSPADWREFVVSWALTAAAWVVADSYRGGRWLAVRES